ncbi:MAG: hypothetical protein IPH22_02185 [Nitrosomonas sp.]|nr:hypothetical protein [Nitrosomonas sp.]
MELLVFILVFFGAYVIFLIITDNFKNPFKQASNVERVPITKPLNFSNKDKQVIIQCAQRMVDIINESLQISNNSKNPSTKISRLRVASDNLHQLKQYASEYPFITLTATSKVEKSISDLNQEFLTAGYFNLNAKEIHRARDLLKEATQLKKEKRYNEACEKLKEAYSANGSEELMIQDYLRLPMYLQLAGKSNEGWKALDEMRLQNKDNFNESTIAKQIKIFFRKEKKYELAVLFSAWEICEIIESDEDMIQSIINMSDEIAESPGEWIGELFLPRFSSYSGAIQTGTTPRGNPIRHYGYLEIYQRLTKTKSLESIKEAILKDLVKTDFIDKADEISKDLQKYILSKKEYHLNEVMIVMKKYITGDLSITEDTLLLSEGKAISSV